jgi:HTH-type transcriptional regulator/antitoxin MqsA
MTNLCPFCEKGTLEPSTRVEVIEHDGKQLSVHGFQFSVCGICHEEMVRADDAKANQKLIADAILAADGKLTTCDLKCMRLRHSLRQEDAANLFGGGQNAFSKYERGEVMPSKPMDLLIRVYDAVPAAREFLEARADIKRPVWVAGTEQASVRLVKMLPRPSTWVIPDGQPWEDVEIEPMRARR